MMRCLLPVLLVPGLALAPGCSSAGASRRLHVGQEPDGHGDGSAGIGSNAGQGGVGGITSVDNALQLRVEDIDEVTIEVITLACAGDCADLEAVATGGNPPYAIEWEDGSTRTTRHVCLDASATLSVTATDTAIDSDEFDYDAQTVSAEVTATVLACPPDGGVATDACFENPGLEGTSALNLTGFMLPGWSDCGIFGGADVCDAALAAAGGFAAPSQGNTAVYMAGAADGTGDLLSTDLCAPLAAGESSSFVVDLWSAMDKSGGFGHIEISGGGVSCVQDELLWTSPTLSGAWQSLCVTLRPARAHTTLTIAPRGLIGIDNVVPVAACPP